MKKAISAEVKADLLKTAERTARSLRIQGQPFDYILDAVIDFMDRATVKEVGYNEVVDLLKSNRKDWL